MQKNIALSISIMAMLTFVSCQREVGQTTATLPPTVTANTTLSQSPLDLLTASPMLTNTVEIKETTIPSSTLIGPTVLPTIVPMTIIPSSTPVSPTIVPVTLTPLPTLEGEALESSVAELLANPMNCDVPCWWGAVPGITSLNEIKHAISPYNFDVYEYEEGHLQLLRLGIGYVEERNDFEVRIGYGFSNSVLTTVSAYSPSVFEVLARYGQPDEVWLSTGITPIPIPFRLNLVYYQEGMAVGYVVDAIVENNMFNGCFVAEEEGLLRLIAPHSATSHKDFPTIFWDDQHYLPLEEATSLTMEDFMQRFSDPSQPQCIETPIELWE